ncbi:hypothetical protein D9M71_297980 [compost metagenome]
MLLVAGVDALGAVAGEEVDVELQAGGLFQYRHAVFLGGAGVDGGFIDDDVALLEHLADAFRGLDQRGEVGLVVLVDWGGHGDDEHVAGLQVVEVGAVAELGGLLEFFVTDFQGGVMAGLEGVDARLVDVKAHHGAVFAEFDGERQADVAETDDGEFDVFQVEHGGIRKIQMLIIVGCQESMITHAAI